MLPQGSSEYLFVYGTLRRGAGHAMAAVLAANSTPVGRAFFQGRLYRVSWYPGAVPSEAGGDRIVGDVFALDADSAEGLLSQLDEYEEARPAPGVPALYRRERRPVARADGREIDAWIYLFNLETAGLERIASGDFLGSRGTAASAAQRPQDSL